VGFSVIGVHVDTRGHHHGRLGDSVPDAVKGPLTIYRIVGGDFFGDFSHNQCYPFHESVNSNLSVPPRARPVGNEIARVTSQEKRNCRK
jgi:hypothetical protein